MPSLVNYRKHIKASAMTTTKLSAAVSKKTWSQETARSRLQTLFKRLDTKPPELDCVFTELVRSEAHIQLNEIEHQLPTQISGALVSVKDLFDISGYVTRAGSLALSNQAVAGNDARAISLLKQSGAIIIGKTNMTELAYSGLGLNPHFGTPDNPVKTGHIPGGSTSGGAVSVATDAADIAIGTDTGGSIRIPAAFTGLVGFKPSQASVSRSGCRDLSTSLDSIGPIARSVHHCEWAWRCMSGVADAIRVDEKPELIVPTNFGMTDLDSEIESGFLTLLKRLRDQGWNIHERKIEMLESYKLVPVWHFSSVESRCIYADQYAKQFEKLDPRVRSRMARADEVSAIDYCTTLRMRKSLIKAAGNELGSSFILLPTVAILPPAFEVFDDDHEYNRLNLLALRNTSMANVIDGCSISLPFSDNGNVMGAMLTTSGGRDLQLLDIARKLEKSIIDMDIAKADCSQTRAG